MTDTRTHGEKIRDSLLKKDPLFYKKIGAKGGKAESPTKGFASWPKEKLANMIRESHKKRKRV